MHAEASRVRLAPILSLRKSSHRISTSAWMTPTPSTLLTTVRYFLKFLLHIRNALNTAINCRRVFEQHGDACIVQLHGPQSFGGRQWRGRPTVPEILCTYSCLRALHTLVTYRREIGYLPIDLRGRYPDFATFRSRVSFDILLLANTHTELRHAGMLPLVR